MKLTHLLTAFAVVAALFWWVGAPLDAQQIAQGTLSGDAAPEEDDALPPVQVIAFRSEAKSVEGAVVLRGRTEAHREVDLRAETAGLVVSQPRRAGARVTEGDLLCRLDPGERQAKLAEARAKLAEAQAENDAAEALVERGITSANTAISRRAALQAAQMGVRSAELDLKRLEIRAPFSGVLETDAAEIGSLLRVGDSCAR
ncbi:MAG: efflux RND transporter periplasmic adaptor subunit, partial [Pseudomonadota bacterium]